MPPWAIETDALKTSFVVTREDPGLGGAVRALFRPRREHTVAVDGIDLRVAPGEIIGYIGVNGAGIALNLATATSAFWIVDNLPLTRAVHELHEFARYPLTLYDRAIRLALTWVVPFGFAAFYPTSRLLGRDVGYLVWIGPIVAVGFAIGAYRLWTFGLAHYTGTGS